MAIPREVPVIGFFMLTSGLRPPSGPYFKKRVVITDPERRLRVGKR